MTRRSWWGLWVASSLLFGSLAEGQARRPELIVVSPPADSLGLVGPVVRATAVLSDRTIRELMDHGFSAQVHFRAELWSTAGWFDNLLRYTEWDLVVRYDPLARRYEAVRVVGDSVTPLGTFQNFADMLAEVERPFRPAIRATPNRSSQYYNVLLSLDVLSLSDLDELRRWVRGDLTPAVRGKRNPGTALSRGARTLLSRLLGGERRTLESRSRTFRYTAPAR